MRGGGEASRSQKQLAVQRPRRGRGGDTETPGETPEGLP